MALSPLVGRVVPYATIMVLVMYLSVPFSPSHPGPALQAKAVSERQAIQARSYVNSISIEGTGDHPVTPLPPGKLAAKSLALRGQPERSAWLEQQRETVRQMLSKKIDLPKSVMTFMVVSPQALQSLGRAWWHTWIKDMTPFTDLVIYTNDCSVVAEMAQTKYPLDKKMEESIRCISKDSAGNTEFGVWLDMYNNYRNKYDWFLRVDERSYVNAQTLAMTVTDLSPANLTYLGKPASGRAEDQSALNLQGRPYCLGMAYMWSRGLLQRLGPELAACRKQQQTSFYDVEIGRCVHQKANINCLSPVNGPLVSLSYHVRYGRAAFASQALVQFPEQPLNIHRKALAIYPLSRSRDYYLFHTQQIMSLSPVYPALVVPEDLDDDGAKKAYERAVQDVQKSCTNNPARQYDVSGIKVAECPATALPSKKTRTLDTMYILGITTAQNPMEPKNIKELSLTAIRMPVSVNESVIGNLTPLDVGYLRAMAKVFMDAKAKKLHRVFIVDSDVVLHCHLQQRLSQVLGSQRCGAQLFTDYQGGVLLLGAQEWASQAWQRVADDTANLDLTADPHADKCYNTHSDTTGSFAAVYHKITYDAILDWIRDNLKSSSPKTFDQVIPYLADLGYITRVALPALVIQDTTKLSRFNPGKERQHPITSPAARASIHRWDTNKYCFYTEFV